MIEIVRYDSEKAFKKDAEKWGKKGYSVLSIDKEKKSKGGLQGAGQLLTLGLAGRFFGRKQVWVVTYQKKS